jgi:hypothetical protein
MRPVAGEAGPQNEVDAVRWLALEEARELLTHDRDRTVLDSFAARRLLERLEAEGTDVLAPLAYLAGSRVTLDPDELHAARRRALLLLAAGGDPVRELELDGRAVRALADDLDTAGRRGELVDALARARATASGLPRVAGALETMQAAPDVAWRWYALALLADELAETDDPSYE